jgi:hypothetical protein
MTAPDVPVTLDSLIRAVEESAPDDRLGQLANASATASQLGDLGDSLLGVFVDRCRRDGRSWAEIGGALGVSKQAVQKRFVTPNVLDAGFERFTARARNVLGHSRDRARELRHNYIGTEHLLLALFDEPEAIAARVLRDLNVTADKTRTAIVGIVPAGTAEVTGDPPFTPRAVRALELALSTALELGHNYIGTEHQLLGLIRLDEGLAVTLLRTMDVEYEDVKRRVVELLSGYSAS